MGASSDFVIKDGVLKKYSGAGGDVVIPDGVKRISARAFRDCRGLRTVVIPASVEGVGKEAFAFCEDLAKAKFCGEVKRIGDGAFWDAFEVRIEASPATFKKFWNSLGNERMSYCVTSLCRGDALTPEEKKYIQKNITSLFHISVLKKDEVPFIKALEFLEPLPLEELDRYLAGSEDFPVLRTALLEYKKEHYSPEDEARYWEIREGKELGVIPRTVAEWKKIFSFEKKGEGLLISRYQGDEYCVAVPERIGRRKVTEIGSGAFSACRKLSSVVIPEGVTRIGNFAFYNCGNLETVTLPQTLEEIGQSAFQGCEGLEKVFFDESRVILGDRAFSGCKALADENGFVRVGNVLYDYAGEDSEISVPEGVEIVGNGAFFKCGKLRSVTLPPSVRTIGKSAFMYCSSLKTVRFSAGIREIEDEAFCGCEALSQLVLPEGLERIGKAAFWRCLSLKEMPIPASLEEIGVGAFGQCQGLFDEKGFLIVGDVLCEYNGDGGLITIPEGVGKILPRVFSKYYSISLRLPKSLQTLGDAFRKCRPLEAIELPMGLKTVETGAFSECMNLRSVTIPDGKTVIEEGAFAPSSLTIHSVAGGFAEQYAKEQNFPFQAI